MRNPEKRSGIMSISSATHVSCDQLAGLSLGEDQILLLLAELDHPQLVEQLDRVPLTDAEYARIAAFHFDIDRNHFSTRRRLLKSVLSDFTGMDAGSLSFRFNAFGKPALTGATTVPLAFNTSHVSGFSLIGLRLGRPLGVDMEQIRPMDRQDSIIRAQGTKREIEFFDSLLPHERESHFFDWWVRKEAIIKAVGTGVSCPLNTVESNMDGQSDDSTVTVATAPSDRYQVVSTRLDNDLVLALAFPGSCSDIRLFMVEAPGD